MKRELIYSLPYILGVQFEVYVGDASAELKKSG